jgi:hypothetical protein
MCMADITSKLLALIIRFVGEKGHPLLNMVCHGDKSLDILVEPFSTNFCREPLTLLHGRKDRGPIARHILGSLRQMIIWMLRRSFRRVESQRHTLNGRLYGAQDLCGRFGEQTHPFPFRESNPNNWALHLSPADKL